MVLLFLLAAAMPAGSVWAGGPVVSTPLAVQIDAPAGSEPSGNLARLVAASNTEGVAVGQWIEFTFDKPVAVTTMTVVNGWAAPESFHQYGRVKTARIFFGDGSEQTITLKDTDKPQVIAIKGGGNTARLTATAVYPGRSSHTPYLSHVAFEGYDPTVRQVTITGRYEGCVHSRSSSSWDGDEKPFFYCARFHADDGASYGCQDDLCFHTQDQVNVRLRVTGVVKPGNILEVLEAKPIP
jgi:hypothetical protein